MKTRELGLVLVQQLTGVEDLHFGYWDAGIEPQLGDLKAAQARYSQVIIDAVRRCTPSGGRILDIGCGTGHLLVQLLDCGYQVDGVIPDDHLRCQVSRRLRAREGGYRPTIFTEKFEYLTTTNELERYDLLLFSESFQYIPFQQNINRWPGLLNTDGHVLICDVFKSLQHGDGGPGDGIFRGGHSYNEFVDYLNKNTICIVCNEDITARTSPSIGLLNDLLMNRIKPALCTLDHYLSTRRPWLLKICKWLLRRQLQKVRKKYLSGYRSQEVFERYKTYRLMVLKRPADEKSL